jgi:four helix bundle protein
LRIADFELNTNMTPDEFKNRTKRFALRVIKLVQNLPSTREGDVLGRQLLRSGTSVAANYRAACRAKSVADFINKLGTVEEESDESALWMELIVAAGIMPSARVNALLKEAGELTAMTVASINKSRATLRKPKRSQP